MADYTSLAIGINRYQYIQPLSYAQDDAQAIHQLLVEETELPPEQALMLTDASPWVYNHPTEPTRDNINHWVEQWLPTQPTALLWFFFSGYGVNWQGEDYLMPIDGNPADIPGTAIRIQDLAAKMQQAGFKNILMLLDINRSPGVIAGQTVGGQIAELAPEKGISLVLSSQIEEASHEAVALGHGMFTAALLEGLRYYSAETTLDNLSRYLYDRLPELSEHHWRPMQHPLIIIPSIEFAQESLLPLRSDEALNALAVETPAIAPSNVVPLRPPILDNGEELPAELLPDPLPEPIELTPLGDEADAAPEPSLPAFGATPPPPGVAASVTSELQDPKEPAPDVLAPVVAAPEPEPEPQPIAAPPVPQPLPSQTKPTKGQQSWLLWGGGTILILGLLGLLQFFRGDRLDPVVDVPAPTTEAPAPNGTTSPPPASTDPTDPAPAATGTLTLEESQAILGRARTLIQSNQASGFSEAIAEANKIPPNAPLYDEAQADMARWSQVIVDIARGRANQGDFQGAIAAAQLVPEHQTAAYQAAQQQVAQWQNLLAQQQQNSEIIRTARRQIRYTQASSYSEGIRTLAAIPADQPGYRQAQDLIGRWSKQIYLIANSRASRQEYQKAIETAQLVPQGTLEYDNAQQAIARWQQGQP